MQLASLDNENKRNQTTAFLLSLVIYALFLGLLFFFELIYIPPEEIEGIELNYGVDLVGTGDIQTTNKANVSPNNYDVKSSEKTETEIKPLKTKPIVTSPSVEKVEKVKLAPAKPLITADDEKSPVIEKETNKTVKKTETKPAVKPAPEENKTKPAPAKIEPPKPEPVKRSVEEGSIMKKGGTGSGSGAKSNSSSNGTIGTRDGVGGNNNGGGKKGEVGDKGDTRGTPDGKSMMGKIGKGSGSGAAIGGLSGWNKRKLTLPDDGSSETGKIVFKVTVDDSGDVVGISVVSSTVSPSVQNFYKNYIQQKLGSVLSPAGTPPPRATGTITINIQSGI
jgi:hypothetical protein